MSRRIIAVVLNLFLCAGGHLAFGLYRRALVWFALEGALWGGLIASVLTTKPLGLYAAIAVLFVLRIACAVDIWRVSRNVVDVPGRVGVVLMWFALYAIMGAQSWAVRAKWVEAFLLPSGSMVPTLAIGDHVLVDKRARTPARGDVVVYRDPRNDKDFVKRVVAIAGDTIEIEGRTVKVNGKSSLVSSADDCHYADLDESGELSERACSSAIETTEGGRSYRIVFDPDLLEHRGQVATRVPEGTIYVLGDNRDNSNDSRFIGTVPVANVKGKALFVWFARVAGKTRWERFGVPL